MLRSHGSATPTVADSAYVDGAAVVIGEVTVGPDASVWPGAVLRGDAGPIRLEEGTNVQDNATVHEGATIGPYATVGHNAIVHAATVERRATVGMGAIVLDDATVGPESIVAANSVVTEETTVPESTLVAGSPAEPIKEVEGSFWAEAADRYVEHAREHAAESSVIEPGPVLPTDAVGDGSGAGSAPGHDGS